MEQADIRLIVEITGTSAEFHVRTAR